MLGKDRREEESHLQVMEDRQVVKEGLVVKEVFLLRVMANREVFLLRVVVNKEDLLLRVVGADSHPSELDNY
jgi:hypothetical protein